MPSLYLGGRKPRNTSSLHCGPYTATNETGILLSRNGRCDYCTNPIITILGSTPPQLPFNINIALVQSRYLGGRKPWNTANFHCRHYTATNETGILLSCNGRYDYCTNPIVTFLGWTHPQLPFNISIGLVQSRYLGGRKRQNTANLHCRPYRAFSARDHNSVY